MSSINISQDSLCRWLHLIPSYLHCMQRPNFLGIIQNSESSHVPSFFISFFSSLKRLCCKSQECLMYWRIFFSFLFSFSLSQRAFLPSVGVCWRRSNPPWSQNPNRPNMKGKCNYPALFQINWTPPPINAELFLFIVAPLSPARDHLGFTLCFSDAGGAGGKKLVWIDTSDSLYLILSRDVPHKQIPAWYEAQKHP